MSGNTISLCNGADAVSATGGDNVVSVGNGRDSISVEGHGQVQLGLSQAAQLPSRHIEFGHLVFEARLRSSALHLARARPLQGIVWSSVVAYNLALFARLKPT